MMELRLSGSPSMELGGEKGVWLLGLPRATGLVMGG